MESSQLKLYSMGRAAENLKIGSTTLEVVPIEHLTMLDGELKSNPTPTTVTGQDAAGNTTSTTVTLDNSVTAHWMPNSSNQITAPCIRRGERVYLYRFADQDTFYWNDTGLDRKYRKLETATYVWNATQDESDNSQTPTNHYYMEVSAHKKAITLGTSKANGEKTAFTVQLNPGDGTFTIADDLGQIVFMDSINHVIHAINADQSEVTLNKQVITIQCQDTVNLTALKAFNLKTQTLNLQCQTATFNASDSISIQTQTLTVSANSFDGSGVTTSKLSGVTISGGKIQCAGVTSTGPVTAPNIP